MNDLLHETKTITFHFISFIFISGIFRHGLLEINLVTKMLLFATFLGQDHEIESSTGSTSRGMFKESISRALGTS